MSRWKLPRKHENTKLDVSIYVLPLLVIGARAICSAREQPALIYAAGSLGVALSTRRPPSFDTLRQAARESELFGSIESTDITDSLHTRMCERMITCRDRRGTLLCSEAWRSLSTGCTCGSTSRTKTFTYASDLRQRRRTKFATTQAR